MAKKKPKLLKIVETYKLKRTGGNWGDYEFFKPAAKSMRAMNCFWPSTEVKKLFGRVLCPTGKTATVKITIEVEGIE